MSTAEFTQPDADRVLAKALFSVQQKFGFNQAELGDVLGLERTSVSRLKRAGKLDPLSKTGQLAICLIRIYRSLFALVGGDQQSLQHWISTPNKHLNGTPKELLGQIQGLIRTMEYLDAMRGKV